MEGMRIEVIVTPEHRAEALRRAILGGNGSTVRLTAGQRNALERLRDRWQPSPAAGHARG